MAPETDFQIDSFASKIGMNNINEYSALQGIVVDNRNRNNIFISVLIKFYCYIDIHIH